MCSESGPSNPAVAIGGLISSYDEVGKRGARRLFRFDDIRNGERPAAAVSEQPIPFFIDESSVPRPETEPEEDGDVEKRF